MIISVFMRAWCSGLQFTSEGEQCCMIFCTEDSCLSFAGTWKAAVPGPLYNCVSCTQSTLIFRLHYGLWFSFLHCTLDEFPNSACSLCNSLWAKCVMATVEGRGKHKLIVLWLKTILDCVYPLPPNAHSVGGTAPLSYLFADVIHYTITIINWGY